MKRRYRSLLILTLLCAVVLPAGVLLWQAGGTGDPEEAGAAQRRAFEAAARAGAAVPAEGERDSGREAIDALIANGAGADGAALDPLPVQTDGSQEEKDFGVFREKWQREDGMRMADARRAFLANPALWPEPKSQQVAMAAATMERDLLRWADACLDDPPERNIGFLKAVYFRDRLRLDALLADTSHLSPETQAKLHSNESIYWHDSRVELPPADRFRELVTAALPAAASVAERAAAEFRVVRYEDSRAALQQLLTMETLYEERAAYGVRMSAPAPGVTLTEAPVPGAPRLEDVQEAIRAEVVAARQVLLQLNAATAQGWPGYLKRYTAAGSAVAGPGTLQPALPDAAPQQAGP